MTSTITKTCIKTAAVAVLCLGLASPGSANAEPMPGMPDFPGIDESAALQYALDHQREICSILDYRFTQADPAVHPIESMVTEIAARGGFNYDTAAFVIGAAMGSSCPQHIESFEAALGIDLEMDPGPDPGMEIA